jgi:hypothetical protein
MSQVAATPTNHTSSSSMEHQRRIHLKKRPDHRHTGGPGWGPVLSQSLEPAGGEKNPPQTPRLPRECLSNPDGSKIAPPLVVARQGRAAPPSASLLDFLERDIQPELLSPP